MSVSALTQTPAPPTSSPPGPLSLPGPPPVVAVTAVGIAEGARGAAAALACAGAAPDQATLLVDAGGRAPRPTLLASAAARRLEERLAAHLPKARLAARGQVCHLAMPAEPEGLATAAAAATVARDGLVVLHLVPAALRSLLDERLAPAPSAVLLRADLAADRALLALIARDLMARGIAVAVLKRQLNWVAERRALFGALGPDGTGGLPTHLRRNLLSSQCYAETHGAEAASARDGQPERRNHAGSES